MKFCEMSEGDFELYKTSKAKASGSSGGVMSSVMGTFKGILGGPAKSDQGIDPKWSGIMAYLLKQKDALTYVVIYLDSFRETRSTTHRKMQSQISECLSRTSTVEAIVDGWDPAPTSRGIMALSGYFKDTAAFMGEQSIKEVCLVAETIRYYIGVHEAALENINTIRVLAAQVVSLNELAKQSQDAFDHYRLQGLDYLPEGRERRKEGEGRPMGSPEGFRRPSGL